MTQRLQAPSWDFVPLFHCTNLSRIWNSSSLPGILLEDSLTEFCAWRFFQYTWVHSKAESMPSHTIIWLGFGEGLARPWGGKATSLQSGVPEGCCWKQFQSVLLIFLFLCSLLCLEHDKKSRNFCDIALTVCSQCRILHGTWHCPQIIIQLLPRA